MGDRENHCFNSLERCAQVFLNTDVEQPGLVTEEAFPGVVRRRIGILIFQLVPMLHVGVVYPNLGAHFGQLADNQFAAAVTRITYILAVARPAQKDVSSGR